MLQQPESAIRPRVTLRPAPKAKRHSGKKQTACIGLPKHAVYTLLYIISNTYNLYLPYNQPHDNHSENPKSYL